MAVAKLLLPSLNLPSKLKLAREPPSLHNHPWGLKKERRRYLPGISSSFHETASIAFHSTLFVLAHAAIGYSNASYYTSLGLFVISIPGLWSLIKTFVEEQKEGGKKAPNQLAGEILSFFTRNNFLVLDKGETITFEGTMVPSRGQAALLTFCTCISLATVALVLIITVRDVGNNWFALTVFSPLAGAYYWKRASRKEQIQMKMQVAEDGTLTEIVVQGDDQQVEQMRRELQLSEKGMVCFVERYSEKTNIPSLISHLTGVYNVC